MSKQMSLDFLDIKKILLNTKEFKIPLNVEITKGPFTLQSMFFNYTLTTNNLNY